MSEQPPDEPSPKQAIDESEFEPVQRDSRFLVRLALGLIVGTMLAIVLGAWMRGAAANCGSSLVRPGSTVIPSH